MALFTIGHSTHPADLFVALLDPHGVRQLADIRTVPRSRRHPQVCSESLPATLAGAGVAYRHVPALGGRRTPKPGSPHTGWAHRSFRGYADHMDTVAFEAALADLASWAAGSVTAVMCAEALWWQCHRRLLADALAARGWAVSHILASESAQPHEITPFARVLDGRVSYPGLL